MRKYWRIVAAILTAVVLCVGCGGKRLSETASAMASLTAEDIAGFESFRWPNVTAEQLVAALNRAAAHEITAEEAAQAEAANTAEDEDFERYIGIPIKNGKYLMAACGAAADIVCVFDAGAACRPPTRRRRAPPPISGIMACISCCGTAGQRKITMSPYRS